MDAENPSNAEDAVTTGRKEVCAIVLRHAGDHSQYEIEIKRRGETALVVQAEGDYEEALQMMRAQLEERNLLLLINRYRKSAFVSTMARQMSDGQACYLVRMGRPVSRRQIVDSFDPAPAREVVTQREADEFLERWLNS
ncbi:hypothetical protein [Nonomuraea cavernae]|uniref:Uncharacterized protein n=1 Tax=Nonomuraea cavernae TaxID=2045107 RepID=A0A918DLG0_9ACTN|nr:hypothetical protein [Nonomuraea cavernae]MCA2186580.1 hypothetical protein [Nonomuraea cavernae]GGO71504.1 hypothetical protein GCM10012289_37400 [Nonomuraea cavernae]